MAKSRAGKKKSVVARLAQLDPSLLQSVLTLLVQGPSEDALDRAQELIYEAWEAKGRRRRIALAKQALSISPLCADAYVILAREDAANAAEAIALYRRAVAAGAEALGARAFAEDVGHFWGLTETRPYMRARHLLALALWANGGRDETVEHLWDMLRLNPGDNQGIRMILLNCLIELGRDEDAAKLVKQYPEDGSTDWLYSAALAVFRAKGDGAAARKALKQAIAANRHVPAYLWGDKKLPSRAPGLVACGGEDEAIAYAQQGAPAWRATPGAFAWAATAAPQLRTRKR